MDIDNVILSDDDKTKLRIGKIRMVKRIPQNGRATYSWAAICSNCNFKQERSGAPNIPPEFLAKRFREAGWGISNDCETAICPSCRTKRPTMSKTDEIKAVALLHRLLTQHFMVDSGHYEDAWNDERVASMTALSVQQVSIVRDTAYGELKPRVNPDLALVQHDIAELKGWMQKEHGDLREMIDSWLKEGATKLWAMSERVEQLLNPAPIKRD